MGDSDDQYEDYHDEQAPQFTKILDLTDGEGGGRVSLPLATKVKQSDLLVVPAPIPQQILHLNTDPSHLSVGTEDVDMGEEDETEDEDDMPLPQEDDGRDDGMNINNGVKLGTLLAGGNVNPNTPGKVVESGHEQTGRWTKQEHEAFLDALRMYGKEWKKVAAKVKTRTVVQTRTHAQKYFQKLQKSQDHTTGGGGAAAMMDFLDNDAPLPTSISKTRHTAATPAVTATTTTATTAPLSSHRKKPQRAQPPLPPQQQQTTTLLTKEPLPVLEISEASRIPFDRRGSCATLTAAQLVSGLANRAPPPKITSDTTGTTEARPLRPQHGFSTEDTPYNITSSVPAGWASLSSVPTSMKIVAPDPMATIKRGKFPEPSPAATGKRKLAEIAAARMLAGVAGVIPPREQMAPPVFSSDTDAVMTDGREDGAATPPLDYHNGRLNLNDAPLPPLVMTSMPRKPALSLQIVNPETLGITHDKRRRSEGGDSPVTPWDGQLEALVNEKAKASVAQNAPAAQKKVEVEVGNGDVKDHPRIGHPVCGPGTAFGRSKLHCAICEMDLESLRSQLGEVANRSLGVLGRLDSSGYAPLHTAASLRLRHADYAVAALEMVRTLLAAGADPNIQDAEGNRPLHWAARAGDRDVAETLLLRNSQMDSKNKNGETALHWGMRAGHVGVNVVSLLVENGARISVMDRKFKRPADVAAEGFLDDEASIASVKARDLQNPEVDKKMSRELKKVLRDNLTEIRNTRANLFAQSNPCRTLVLHHPECLEHVPKSRMDWEAPDRVLSIMARISPEEDGDGGSKAEEIKKHEVTLSSEFERANLDLLSRVHSTEYLHFVQNLSKDLEKQVKAAAGTASGFGDDGGSAHVVPFTPMVQRSMIKVSESAIKSVSNSDTAFSAGSLRAARRAAGAVQHAVDCVLVGRNRNSFCVVRPPGHHAGVNGLLDGGESCGFCIFNNVAAGALYAISDERLLCERCAIVDIDVHHGNGTEEIVRKCHDPSKLFFFSIHLYDNDKKKRAAGQYYYKFYPGTGSEDDLAMNIINVPIVPLWKEQAGPSAPVSRTHNTRQKARSSDQEEDSLGGTPNTSIKSSDAASENGSAANQSPKPKAVLGSGRLTYREAIRNRLLPALRAFNPDLILISAGFDAAKGDVGNARHERGGRERIGLDLEPEDYAWTTRKILEIADICCSGRVVSVLEGGYGRSPVSNNSTTANGQNPPLQPLDRSIFAECAMRHLHALIDPYDTERRFSPLT